MPVLQALQCFLPSLADTVTIQGRMTKERKTARSVRERNSIVDSLSNTNKRSMQTAGASSTAAAAQLCSYGATHTHCSTFRPHQTCCCSGQPTQARPCPTKSKTREAKVAQQICCCHLYTMSTLETEVPTQAQPTYAAYRSPGHSSAHTSAMQAVHLSLSDPEIKSQPPLCGQLPTAKHLRSMTTSASCP